ncbi:MAG: hypothetical protein IT535_09835, partial [Bauldia sp.]|nr:hypothetical protein [Bauldia sp.]
IDYGKSLVLEGQRDGAIRDFPGDLLNSFLRGSIRNTLKRLRGKNGSLTPKLRRQLAELCWSTIANGQEPAAGHLAARRPPALTR